MTHSQTPVKMSDIIQLHLSHLDSHLQLNTVKIQYRNKIQLFLPIAKGGIVYLHTLFFPLKFILPFIRGALLLPIEPLQCSQTLLLGCGEQFGIRNSVTLSLSRL